ncbi:MAG: hypothetical protein AAGJ97_13435, partial [Planctomycetota bacterium]
EARVTGLGKGEPKLKLTRDGKTVTRSKAEFAAGPIAELAIPRAELGVVDGDWIRFYVEALKKKQSLDRAPREGSIESAVPDEDFELREWQA